MLSTRALNRALLARQLLLERRKIPVARALEHLVGLQSQVPQNPYVALWSRLAGFRAAQLSRLIRDRKAVRLALQRSTIHLVTRGDCLTLRPVLQPVQDRNFWVGSPYGRRIKGMDLGVLVAMGLRLLDEQPRTPAELGVLLHRAYPKRDAMSLSYALRNLAALVQVPPRGLWGESGAPRHAPAESWLGRPLSKATAPDRLVLRYLGAFGPASVQDAQIWCGLTGLQEVFDRLKKRLRVFRDDRGAVLYDLPRAPRPDADTPAPPRFLPEYDNIFLSHVDRSRIIGTGSRRRVPWARAFGQVVVDGFLSGAWRVVRAKGRAVLKVVPVRRWSKAERVAVDEEGERLLAFLSLNE